MKIVFNIILCSIITFSCFSQSTNDSIIEFNFYPEDYVEYKPLLNQIDNGQEFIIYIESYGCFHHSEDSLKIKKNNNLYSVEYNGLLKELNEKETKSLNRFENELKVPRQMICTSTTIYTIVFLNESQKVTDGSCTWNGYYKLMEDLSFNIK